MNIKLFSYTSFVVVLALLLPLSAIGGDEPGRLPPNVQKYPARGSAEQASYGSLTHYTTASSSKVIDFYRKSLEMDPVERGKFLVGEDVSRLDRPGHLDSDVWLNIYSAADLKRNTLDDKDLFGFLQGEIMVKRIRSEQDLQPVKQKYAHLAKAWYPDVDAKKKLKSCGEATRGNVTASRKKMGRRNKAQEKEMVEQIQQLMAQGRHQEAAALAQGSAKPGMETSRAMQQDNETDHWDKWLACLDELDKHDFQTKIEMGLYHNRHFKPSTKDERKRAANDASEQQSERQAREQKRAAEKKDAPANVSEQMNKFKKMFKF